MFSIPLTDLTFEHVNEFCKTKPREGVSLDYKSKFPKSLEKTIAAFANTYGGHILVGIGETDVGEPELPIQGMELRPGLREQVVSKALQAIHPPVYPEVKVVEFASNSMMKAPDRAVVVIRVHESDSSPHAINSGTDVYIRTDNISNPERKATVGEIEWLSQKRKKCLDLKTEIIEKARRHAQCHLLETRKKNVWSTSVPSTLTSVQIVPFFPRRELASPNKLSDLAESIAPVQFQVIPHLYPPGTSTPVADGIRFPSSPDPWYVYTEFNRFGLFFSEFGFPWENDYEHLLGIYDSVVFSLLASSLIYSLRVYQHLDFHGVVEITLDLNPASDRFLMEPRRFNLRRMKSIEDKISITRSGSVNDLMDTKLEVLTDIYEEFLWAFGTRIRTSDAQRELEKMEIHRVVAD